MRVRRIASPLVLASFVVAAWACSDHAPAPAGTLPNGGSAGSSGASAGSAGTGPSAGAAGTPSAGAAGSAPVVLAPGEICDDPDPSRVRIHLQDSNVFVAPSATRSVRLVLQPDACVYTPLAAKLDDPTLADVTLDRAGFDLRHASAALTVTGKKAGKGTIELTVQVGGQTITRKLTLEVRAADIASCTGKATGKVNPGAKIGGSADVRFATLGLQARADTPPQATEDGFTYDTSIIWSVPAFDAEVGCAEDILPSGYVALGSADTFGPVDKTFPRQIPMTIPIEPSAIPAAARGRTWPSRSGARSSRPRASSRWATRGSCPPREARATCSRSSRLASARTKPSSSRTPARSRASVASPTARWWASRWAAPGSRPSVCATTTSSTCSRRSAAPSTGRTCSIISRRTTWPGWSDAFDTGIRIDGDGEIEIGQGILHRLFIVQGDAEQVAQHAHEAVTLGGRFEFGLIKTTPITEFESGLLDRGFFAAIEGIDQLHFGLRPIFPADHETPWQGHTEYIRDPQPVG